MNRTNEIEKHLLSRSYSSQARAEELLATRYTSLLEPKSSIILLPAGEFERNQQKEHRVFLTKTSPKDSGISGERKRKTRTELHAYIKTTLDNQKKLTKKIQAHDRKVKKGDKLKPFPVERLLEHYSVPRYEEFIGLNYLWQLYIQDLLMVTNALQDATQLLPKLTTADYTGCLLTVIESRSRTLIGTRGIVAWDTQHSFILCVPRKEDSKEWNEQAKSYTPSEQVGGFRIIPKKGSLFAFDVVLPSKNPESMEEECIGFTISGSRFELRSVDRSSKKFKNHRVDDML